MCDVNTGPVLVGGYYHSKYESNVQHDYPSDQAMGIFDWRCPHAYPEDRSKTDNAIRLSFHVSTDYYFRIIIDIGVRYKNYVAGV